MHTRCREPLAGSVEQSPQACCTLSGSKYPLAVQSGQSLVEYALIIAFVAVGVVGALFAFGSELSDYYFNNIVNVPPF